MKLKTPYTAYMTVAALLALVFLGAWAYIAYQSYGLRSEIADLSAKEESAVANDSYLLSIKDTLRDSKDDLSAIDSRFIAKDGIPGFIDMLEAKASAANVKADLGSINLDESGDPLMPRALSIHMGGSGAWKDCVAYISAVESLPYAIRVNDLQLSKSGGDPTKSGKVSDSWDFSADVTLYIANAEQTQ
ncbi:MAG TPA: hypothetical protein VFT82_00140 [Candidatus Paceibacterota bacterium]|nr:hypothetical protein [Candidatus Paceibacterota bacterium]